MNPYDFVPIDIAHPPVRKIPVWHNALTADPAQAGKLYSGHLYLYIISETPLFIRHANAPVNDPQWPAEHISNNNRDHILPGTSLKGLLRTVVETLCHGCLTVINNRSSDYTVPGGFATCQENERLCIACRLFGMMGRGSNAEVFRGKVNIGDALTYDDTPVEYYDSIYTAILDTPKPRHSAFYLNCQGQIAGRKFYFHHQDEPRTEHNLREIPRKPGEYRNQHIRPLATGTEFSARIDFTSLEPDEFAALLHAITLLPDMRHKIGYGKPIGLGSIRLEITELHLVDYATRYSNFRARRGLSTYNSNEVADLLAEQMATFDPDVHRAWNDFRARPELQHLAAIWTWDPESLVKYSYPSQDWFKRHAQAGIAETRNLYPGE